jgi:hypothetical protein
MGSSRRKSSKSSSGKKSEKSEKSSDHDSEESSPRASAAPAEDPAMASPVRKSEPVQSGGADAPVSQPAGDDSGDSTYKDGSAPQSALPVRKGQKLSSNSEPVDVLPVSNPAPAKKLDAKFSS